MAGEHPNEPELSFDDMPPEVAIAVQLSAVKERLEKLESIEYGRMLATHDDRLDKIEDLLAIKEPAFLMGPWVWNRLIQSEAEEAWAILTRWIDVYIIERYGRVEKVGEDAVPRSTKIGPCWFAHEDIRDIFSALWWNWRQNHKPHVAAQGPPEFVLSWRQRAVDVVYSLGSECVTGCVALQKPQNEITKADRDEWIAADVAARPEEKQTKTRVEIMAGV